MSGLLGGAVYVNAFTLIAHDVTPAPLRELALSAASVADSFGILLSDATGVLIQGVDTYPQDHFICLAHQFDRLLVSMAWDQWCSLQL